MQWTYFVVSVLGNIDVIVLENMAILSWHCLYSRVYVSQSGESPSVPLLPAIIIVILTTTLE